MKYDAALFDADGVLTLPEEFFSRIYARSHGLPEEHFEPFFKGQFRESSIGKTDLKELIVQHKDLWMTDDPDALLKQWFEAENVRNEELLAFIQELREKGLPCFVASVQEKYRSEYFKDVMFKDEFDGFYISCDLGVKKPDSEYFQKILDDLQQQGITDDASRVFFVDDSQENVDGAKSVGIDAHFYESFDTTKSLLQ